MDLRALYSFDVLEALESSSSRPSAMALELIGRLRFEPMSQYRGEAVGTEDIVGWDQNSTILAAMYNVLAATGKGKKLSKKDHYPVPEVNKPKKKFGTRNPIKSVKDINWANMMGGLGNG